MNKNRANLLENTENRFIKIETRNASNAIRYFLKN